MTYELILMYIGLHLLADFYLQPEKLSCLKMKNYLYLLVHGFIYFFVFLVIGFFIVEKYFVITLVLGVSHLLIDLIKTLLLRIRVISKRKDLVFMIDQIIHFAIILILIGLYAKNHVHNHVLLKHYLWLQVIVSILFIGKPSNIIIKELFGKFKPQDNENTNEFPKAGSAIGFLERAILLFCIIMGYASAFGFIIAAKSIARYEKIKDDKQFSEYYLIGTLASVILTFFIYLVSFIIFKQKIENIFL